MGSAALSTVKEQEESPKLSLDSVKSNSLPDEKEARRLSMIGYGLSAKQAAELEQKLAKNPDDVNTITLLISYCHSNSADKLDNEKREKYILWMIEHYPGSAVLDLSECRLDSKSAIANQKAKKLWIEQVEKNPSNSNVLWNAANGVAYFDKVLAEQFYVKGQALDQENIKWAYRLGNYYFWGNQPEKALNEYKKVYSKAADGLTKVNAITRMAKSAADCGKLQEAGEYVLAMQRLAEKYGNRNEDYGRLLYNGNLTLGRIALKQGKTDDAGKYLLEASKTPVSLKDMPDFTLVKELLAAGQKETVLTFFQSCSQFWDKTRCDDWIKQINDGKTPDFKYNPWEKSKVKPVKPETPTAAPAPAPDPGPLTADAIIAKMAETYAKCKTYQDSGVVKTVFIQAGGNRTNEQPFTTAFIRPGQFRFESKEKVDNFLKEKQLYIVWRKGDEVLSWFFVFPEMVKKAKSLGMGLAGATGISSGAAHTIPVLLLPELGGTKLSDIKEAKLLENGTFDNVNCFRIQGKFVYSHNDGKTVSKPTVIWVDKNTFLVRRIDAQTDFIEAKFRTEVTTTYYPVMNRDIPEKVLEFDPPGGSEMLKQVQPESESSTKNTKENSVSAEKEADNLALSGNRLNAKQAAELEQKLSQNPGDVDTIIKLLGYWRFSKVDDAAPQKRTKYILWMIEHHPDSAILGLYFGILDDKAVKSKEIADAAKKLWIEQVGKNPRNLQVLWNAGNSMYGIDKTLSEQFLLKGQALDQEDSKWAARLGDFYFWEKQPEKALNEYKKAYPKITSDISKVFMISRMATSAFAIGKLQEAGEYALEMQRLAETYGNKNENYGRLVFNSNLLLGRIALKQGKTNEAGKSLLEAGKTPTSLKEGPDFTLVKDLLAAGKKDVVVQFFQSCSQYWDKAKCDEWIKQINEGKTPKFKDEPKTVPKAQSVKPEAKPETDANAISQNTAKPEAKTESAITTVSVLSQKNSKLTDAEAAELEKKVARNPEDIKSISLLLEYYFGARAGNTVNGILQKLNNTAEKQREKYILWLIENHPEADVLGSDCGRLYSPVTKKLWLEQLEKHPDDLKIVANGAHYFANVTGDDYGDLAIKYFNKAKILNPGNSYFWDYYLGAAYESKSWQLLKNNKQDPESVKPASGYSETALGYFENAFTHSPEKENIIVRGNMMLRDAALTNIVKIAFKVGNFNKVEEYAGKMSPDSDRAFFIGMIAAKKGNIDTAGECLLDYGRALQKNRVWPDLSLANELLKNGKRNIVLEFLNACSKFRQSDGFYEQLIKEIENGETPDLSETAMKMRDDSLQKSALKLAQTAAEKWLALVDEGKYLESWTTAATSLKEKETADAWQKMLKTERGSLGKVLSRKFGGSSSAVGLSQKLVFFNIQHETVFENKQVEIETIDTIPDKDGQWRVSKYYIRKIEDKAPATKSVTAAVTEQAMKGWKLSDTDAKDDELTIKRFEKAIKLDPKNSFMRYSQLGDVFNSIGMKSNEKSPEAAAAFEKALLAYENAYANATAKEKESSVVLRPMAAAARKAGNLEKTEKYNNMLVAAKIITATEKATIFAPRPEAAVAKETGKRARPDAKQRMENIVFPKVDFKDADIFTVIRYLHQNSRRYDPDFEGIVTVLGFTKKQADGVPKITMKHTNISMANLLDDICRIAGMKYRIDEDAVVLFVASAVIPQESVIQKKDMTLSGLPEGKITRKLNSIIIPRINFEDISIPAAVKILREQSKKFDPEWEGVDIFLRFKEGEDNKAVVNLILTNKTLGEAILFLCQAAKLKFQVEKYAVVISDRADSAAPDQDSANDKPALSEAATLALKGDTLTTGEAAELEKKLSQNPDDIKSITMLLGYYFLKQEDKDIRKKRENYILWLIKNHPDAEVLGIPYGQLDSVVDNYAEAKKLWLEQLEKHPDNLKIVGNFARSVVREDIDLAIKCFEKAIKLDPKNSRMLYWNLGGAYELKGMFGKDRKPVTPKDAAVAFENALQAYENAYAHSTAKEQENEFLLIPLSETAFKAGKLDKAEKYAKKLLETTKNSKNNGRAVYCGNCVLGKVALRKGDIDAAGKYLLEAGKSKGSAFLNAPNLDTSLAQELLAIGKRDIVLEFLKGCSKFWTVKGVCDQFIKEMENGGTPDLSTSGIIMKRAFAKPDDKKVTQDTVKLEAAFSVQDRAVKMAQTAATEWLALVDDGKYPESWTAASTFFKGAVTADAWTQMLKTGQTPFGKMLSRKMKSAVYRTSLPGAPDGQYVVIQYDTTFENKKDAVETVTPMLDKDGQWRVSGYYIK